MTKITKIENLDSALAKVDGLDGNPGGYVFEFNGSSHFLSIDEVETHLKKYFKIRENLKKEKQLRKDNATLNDAWEKYQAILALTK